MKANRIQLLLALASGAAVLLVAAVDLRRSSPGALASVHAQLEEFQNGDGCAECHGGWIRSMPESCLDCHEPVAEHIESGQGLHGALDETQAMACALCHSEHHGPRFALVNLRSFAMASSQTEEEFDHSLLGFEFDGEHAELDCTVCHEHAEDDVLVPGTQRFMGLQRDCASCHDDPHEVTFPGSCADCHVQSSFDDHIAVGHDEFLPLLGGHADLGCRVCHGAGEEQALEVLGASSLPAGRDCLACHASPHAPAFARGVAQLGGLSAGDQRAIGASCGECHTAEHEGFSSAAEVMSPAQHARSGFDLEDPHRELDCADCHSPDVEDFSERYPGRARWACAACHEDPHGGQFAEGPFAGKGCIACHAEDFFEPHEFSVRDHEQAGFELRESHAEAGCQACHLQVDADGVRGFRGTDSTCAACHNDVHNGSFEAFAEDLAPVQQGLCARCHVDTHFTDVSEFAHAEWTGFPLAGAHGESDCESCHPRAAEPDEDGRTLGSVAEHFGEFTGCVTCHADPHHGVFDFPPRAERSRTTGKVRSIGSKQNCARCHVERSFRAFPAAFDHGLWTGLALDGAHSELGCATCHEPLRRADALGRTWKPAVGKNCVECHDSPHAGQFAQRGATDCTTCHLSTVDFSELEFHHDLNTEFPLDRSHKRLACAECHKTWKQGDSSIVRYRGLETDCTSCHGLHEDRLRTSERKSR